MADRTQLIREWLIKADKDLKTAKLVMANGEMELYEAVCFHTQQAAEKYLKALLIKFDITPPKTHDLSALLNLLKSNTAVESRFYESAEFLNPYAVDIRYPVEDIDVDTEEVQTALEHCRIIRDFVLTQV